MSLLHLAFSLPSFQRKIFSNNQAAIWRHCSGPIERDGMQDDDGPQMYACDVIFK